MDIHNEPVTTLDEYLTGLSAADRATFERVRDIVLRLAPQAVQGTSYGMAALLYKKRPLLGFRAAKQHLSLFPFSPKAVDAAEGHLDGFAVSKGTVRFSAAQPLPDAAVTAMVRQRMGEIDEG